MAEDDDPPSDIPTPRSEIAPKQPYPGSVAQEPRPPRRLREPEGRHASPDDFRETTMQSALDDTQERPPYVPPLEPDPFPPVQAVLDRESLHTFVAVMAATGDRIATGQEKFLDRLGVMLTEDDGSEDSPGTSEASDDVASDVVTLATTNETLGLLRGVSRDLRILIAVALTLLVLVLMLVALSVWFAGRLSQPLLPQPLPSQPLLAPASPPLVAPEELHGPR